MGTTVDVACGPPCDARSKINHCVVSPSGLRSPRGRRRVVSFQSMACVANELDAGQAAGLVPRQHGDQHAAKHCEDELRDVGHDHPPHARGHGVQHREDEQREHDHHPDGNAEPQTIGGTEMTSSTRCMARMTQAKTRTFRKTPYHRALVVRRRAAPRPP